MIIEVQDFQSIARATLDAQGLTVLVGPNDRGKSALQRAVEGALFNRTGDQFVRLGAKSTTVRLELPTRSGDGIQHSVQWVKGGGSNFFEINGERYDKVGTKAPKALQDLGFRDVLIGARVKDDGKLEGGEWLRPQVARQFDRIFLLDMSGTVLNEALVQLSRVAVLQRANRICSSDLRAQKSLLKIRQDDFAQADAARVALEPIVAQRARIQALQARMAAVGRQQDQVRQLRALVEERVRQRSLVARSLPPARTVGLPDLTRVDQLRLLVTARQRAVQAAAGSLPKERRIKKTVVTAMQKWARLQPLVIEQRQHRNWVEQYQAVMDRRDRDRAQWLMQLDQLKAEIKVCPVCDRPF